MIKIFMIKFKKMRAHFSMFKHQQTSLLLMIIRDLMSIWDLYSWEIISLNVTLYTIQCPHGQLLREHTIKQSRRQALSGFKIKIRHKQSRFRLTLILL